MQPALRVLAVSLVLSATQVAADVPCDPGTYPGLSYRANAANATPFIDATLAAGTEQDPGRILVVLDLDNTLLANFDDLGSDQWYRWQSRLNEQPPSPMAVATRGERQQRGEALLDAQRLLTATLPMRLTEPGMAREISNLQGLGYPVMVLTARGPESLSATRRELARNGLDLRRTAPESPSGPLRLPAERDTLYQDGVLMVSGQDKGIMLQALLRQLDMDYHRIIFLDDRAKNVCNMVRAYRDQSDKLIAFRYDGVRGWSEPFLNDPDRQRATDDTWRTAIAGLPDLCGSIPGVCDGGDPMPVQVVWNQSASTPLDAPADALPTVRADPQPPPELAGEGLRAWLKNSWYEGSHRGLGYADAHRAMFAHIDVRGDGRVHGVYSGFNLPKLREGATPGRMLPINAQYTVPRAWFEDREPMRSDIHHLFPTHKAVGESRGQDPFGEIPDAQTRIWYGSTGGRLIERDSPPESDLIDTFGKDIGEPGLLGRFEPPDDHKGDLARALFYFYTMYPNAARQDITHLSADGLEGLHTWHLQDPPDAWERQRNQRIGAAQGNRNPYIDHPGIACRAWGLPCPGAGD